MIKMIASGAAVAALFGAPAFAQMTGDAPPPAAPTSKGTWYVGVGLGGGSVTEDGTREDGFDFEGDPIVFEGEIDYDAGFAGSLLVGYDLSSYVAVEAETTGRVNDFDGNIGDADFAVSTLMAGVVLKAPLGVVEPYAGAAAGLVSNNLEGGDNAFGYQLKGGLRVPFGRGHAVGAEASYVFTDGFDVETDFGDVELDYGHAAYMVTYRYRFGR